MLKPGDLVGPYEIRGFLGQGGMGQVYRAFDPRLERTVALKVIVVPERLDANDSARMTGEFSARLLREARAVASLSHPNVVGIFDVGESGGRLYLAMEYVVGSTLRNLTTSADASVPRKLRWLADVARALEVAHKAGLVHRDVKPENVMVREDGLVKVLDFGIARRTMTPGQDQQQLDTVTGSGAIAGTPVYMAPEQIKGNDVDARCDQFAWGVMAYELLAGERPWPDTGDVLSVVARILTDPPPSLREKERAKDVPAPVEETIRRTLAKDPSARFPSMAEVADAIEAYAQQSTGGDRVRIVPPISHPNSTEPAAYAATTRIPTSVSVLPSEAPASKKQKGEKKRKARARKQLMQLAVPLTLLAGLVVLVVVVRKKYGQPIVAPAHSGERPLSLVPEAESTFKDAMREWRDGASAKARATLRRAIELDPTFASAHLELAIQSVQEDPAGAQAAFQNAFEHRHMLSQRDSDLLEASEPYVRARPDLEEWETRLTAAVFRHTRDPELQLFLGRARERKGADEGAKQAYETALRIDRGFVPALAALAVAERNLGRIPDALATTERCLKQSPVASLCLETRYQLLGDTGDCHRARETAAQWRQLEPTVPRAQIALARALYGDGAPRPSVEEALSLGWSLQPVPRREAAEQWDRMYLSMADGDLERADALAKELEAKLPPSADQYDHAQPTRIRVNVLYEMEALEESAKVAQSFLDRKDAWTPFPFSADPSIGFYEPLYRAGKIDRAELDKRRARWIADEKHRIAGSDQTSPRAVWLTWNVWGGFAETKDEALEAIAKMPAGVPLPVGSRRGLALDFSLGKVYALVGRADEALPHLQRVTDSCSSLEDAMLVARARFYLGMAWEAKGQKDLARAAYERVVSTWPKTTKSRTTRMARERLLALGPPK
ncbi:MAG: protein kinase [Deltaproteobacteria bacterium]|nr:protein kinase [Deltaproteobacteria bacterium]